MSNVYEPYLMQWKIHLCPAVEILAGGQAGPGKTRALVEDAINKCRTQQHARTVFFRETMDELQKVIDDSKRFIDGRARKSGGEATYNHNDHRWTFHDTQSYLRFDSLPNEDAKYAHQSEEYDAIYVDECNHLSGETLRYLRTRMRTVHDDDEAGEGTRRTAVYRGATNPGGKGHNAVRERYVVPPYYDVELVAGWSDDLFHQTGNGWFRYPEGKRGQPGPDIVWRPDEDDETRARNAERRARGVPEVKPNTRCFIPGKLEDNPILYNDPNYEATLLELAGDDPQVYAALRHGDWNVFAGQVFMEFSRQVHVVPPIVPPGHWPKWRSFDWGYSQPFCCLWLTQNPADGQIIVYRESYGIKHNDRDICERIRRETPAYEGIPVSWMTVADPAMWANLGNDYAQHRAEVFERLGVPLIPANHDRAFGKQAVHRGLALRPQYGDTPGLVFTANCVNLIRTLPTLTYDKHKPEDVNTKEEDHAYDALRYGLLATQAEGMRSHGGGMTRLGTIGRRAA